MAVKNHLSEKRGRIVRVKMTNFVTYDSMECFPGKGLNMVIGPNGSGKSTLLSAIVLGLGGKPSVLGRSPKAEDYIKTGTNKAVLEIELFEEGKNIIIERTIEKDGKSSWRINNRNANLKDVDNKTKSLNIQIDNLCQVLPQDRVQDFARMNKQELLESTQKAVGKDDMSKIHADLKNLQNNQKTLENLIRSEKEKFEVAKNHVERLKNDVEKMEKRQGIEREINACKLKLEIYQYASQRQEVIKVREEKNKIEANIKKLELKLGPIEKEIKDAQHKLTLAKNKRDGMYTTANNLFDNAKKRRMKIDEIKQQIIETEHSRDFQLEECATQEQEIKKRKQNISRLRNDMAAQAAVKPPNDNRKRELEEKINMLRNKLDEHKRKEMRFLEARETVRREAEDIMRKKQGIENVRKKRLQNLRQMDNNAYQAALWVEENRHRFQGNVYLPMIVELEVTHPQFARHIESAIGRSDLVAFICESKQDLSLLVEEVKNKQQLRINILHSSGEPRNFTHLMPLSELNRRSPGFHGYLIDFVSAPQALLNLLLSQKSFHQIPVGGDDVDLDRVPNDIRLFFAGDLRTVVKQSQYGSREFLKTSDTIPQARCLTGSIDQQQVSQLNERLGELEQKLRQCEEQATDCKKEYQKDDKERQECRAELQQLTQASNSIQTMQFQLNKNEKDLQKMEREHINPGTVQEECKQKVKRLVLQLVEAQEPLFDALKNADKYSKDYELLEIEVLNAQNALNNSKQHCKAEQKALTAAKSDLEQINNKLADVKTAAQQLLSAFEKKHKKKMQQVQEENAAVFNVLPNSIPELESTIDEKMTQADLIGGRSDADILGEYRTHLSQVERLEASIQVRTNEKENVIETMTQRQNQWRADLDDLVSKINAKFTRYFSELRCAGQVQLYTGCNEHDYDNYGLRIRVKFRDEGELADLDGNLQSGGERAVATAIYMLSLQELTPVPFRLVDEINQGMDPVNERRVYEMLMASSSQPETPQYFLLTPKLLKDLDYSKNMTVMCIFNAPGAPSHQGWNLEKMMMLQRQRKNGTV